MNSPDLDRLLSVLRQRRGPALDSRFEAEVWDEIHRRREVAPLAGGRADSPAWVALGAAAAIAVGVGMAWTVAPGQVDSRAALGLEAFAPQAPGLPSTVLTAFPR